ncbi:tudor domain-containing 6-like [Diretmus argenteus]
MRNESPTKPIRQNVPTDPKLASKSFDKESQKKGDLPSEPEIKALPKPADLPSKSLTWGMEADVLVSHCNSPLSFYVQFVSEEEDLFSIVEKLNDGQSTRKTIDIKDVHPGDLVQAEFPEDSSWYRAVVREIHGNTRALVEFVDFGNTAMISISKMCRLSKPLLKFPTYSTHCMLSGAAALGKEVVLDPEVVSTFKKDIGNGDKELTCRFIRQSGSVWEVSLDDSGMKVVCKVPTRGPTAFSAIISEKLEQVTEKPDQSATSSLPNKSTLPLLDFVEGQQLEAYVTAISGAQTFWCQFANSEELDKLTLIVSEVGNAAQHKPVDATSLSHGSPCIALYADDEAWYRAQVISKNGDVLSILFVDYGNRAQVNVRDVREMPPELIETPSQAFLCELEGFDASHGSWDDGAVDALSDLITDKLLQLTVLRVTRGESRIKCVVQVECEGQVINETVKAHWKCFTKFGMLRVAEYLPAASACFVWSSAVKCWCKARILKKLRDSTLVVLDDYDTQMIVNPDSVFETLSDPEQCDDDDRTDFGKTSSHMESEGDPACEAETVEREQPEHTAPTQDADLKDAVFEEQTSHSADDSLDPACEAETVESEQPEHTAPTQDADLKDAVFEEEKSHSADDSLDPACEAETVESEQPEHTAPTQDADLKDDVFEEETCHSADDSLDPACEAETVEREQPEHTAPTQDADVKDDVFEEEKSHSADDSLDPACEAETVEREQPEHTAPTQDATRHVKLKQWSVSSQSTQPPLRMR